MSSTFSEMKTMEIDFDHSKEEKGREGSNRPFLQKYFLI